jgi:hypothetical protein
MVLCSNNNPAKRRYLKGSLIVWATYTATVFTSGFMVKRWHPQGWRLFLAAALPSIPLFFFAYVVGRYLREERDDYQRHIVIRGMLWATAVTLSVSVFADFLHAYGWQGSLPPFTEFVLFWIAFAVVMALHRVTDRVGADE